MKCEEALLKIDAYINDSLSIKETEEFLAHIRECPECYDELETYYTINVGTKYLENENMGSYNIPRMLKENLREKEKYIRRKQLLTKTIFFFSLVAGIGIAFFYALFRTHRTAKSLLNGERIMYE